MTVGQSMTLASLYTIFIAMDPMAFLSSVTSSKAEGC